MKHMLFLEITYMITKKLKCTEKCTVIRSKNQPAVILLQKQREYLSSENALLAALQNRSENCRKTLVN